MLVQGLLTLIALLIEGIYAYKDELDIDLTNARVYSSPLVRGSLPEYAVDNDFLFNSPTCIEHDKRFPDSHKQYWIMIDLGVEYKRISEIRISHNPSKASDLSQTEVYLASGLSFPEDSVSTEIPWAENAIYQDNVRLCGIFGEEEDSLSCREPITARWIVIKRRGKPLSFCLISIYIEDAHSEVFVKLTKKITGYYKNQGLSPRGTAFRFERNMLLGRCRLECIKESTCQAILHAGERWTSVCQLIKDFEISGDDQLPVIDCKTENCSLEENIAHRGDVVSMIKDPILESGSNEDIKDGFIMKLNRTSEDTDKILNSIELKGTIRCNSDKCTSMEIFQRNSENATYCNKIDPTVVKNLEKILIFCVNDETLTGVTELYMRWRSFSDFQMAKHSIDIKSGLVRLTDQQTSLQNDIKMGFDDSIQAVTTQSTHEEKYDTTEVPRTPRTTQTVQVTTTKRQETTVAASLRTTQTIPRTTEAIPTTFSSSTPFTNPTPVTDQFETFTQKLEPSDEIIEEGFFNTRRSIDKQTTLWLIVGIIAAAFISIILLIIFIAYKCSRKPVYDFDIK